MSKDQREKFLSGLHVGIVSIPREGKGPLTVPIWYDYEPGGEPWMITGRTSIKGKLLENGGRISLCVQTEEAPYQYVSIEGPFSISEPTAAQGLAMAVRYLGEKQGQAYADSSGGEDSSIIFSIKPETWYTVDYNKQ